MGLEPAITICPRGAALASSTPCGAITAPDVLRGRVDLPGRSPRPSTATRAPAPPGQCVPALHTIAPGPVPAVGLALGKSTCAPPLAAQADRTAGGDHGPGGGATPLRGGLSAHAGTLTSTPAATAAASRHRRRRQRPRVCSSIGLMLRTVRTAGS